MDESWVKEARVYNFTFPGAAKRQYNAAGSETGQ